MPPQTFFSTLTNCIKCHNLVDQEIDFHIRLKTYDDIHNAIDKFKSIIQTTAWASLSNSNSFITSKTEKRRARKRCQTFRLPAYKALYNKFAN